MSRLIVWSSVVAVALACASNGPAGISADEVKGPFVWGAAEQVHWVRHIAISGQPDRAGFEAAQRQGVSYVIDLRDPNERDWDESAVVRETGLDYFNVPIPAAGPFPQQAIERIEAIVSAHPGEPALVHCSSGNRAGGWLATHLAVKHAMPVEDALDIGRSVGITKDGIAQKVTDYVK